MSIPICVYLYVAILIVIQIGLHEELKGDEDLMRACLFAALWPLMLPLVLVRYLRELYLKLCPKKSK